MKMPFGVIAIAYCMLNAPVFCEEENVRMATATMQTVMNEEKINDIVTDVNTSRVVIPNYLFGYRLNERESDKTTDSWVKRHPALFGAVLGFGTGFVIGYVGGDDGLLYDFSPWANGIILGGKGAVAGAIIAKIASD